MSDYISREDATKVICEWGVRQERIGRYAVTIHELKQNTADMLDELPAADVVPVVRCDDCVYYGSRRWCELHSSVFDDNAFCSYGERKETGMMKWEAEEKGYSCNDCFLSMQNCYDMSICCEDETGLCDYFEEMDGERKE